MDFREEQTLCREANGTLVIKVRQFSDVSVHKPYADSSGFIDYDLSTGYHIDENYTVTVYANGRDSSTEGQVSLDFQCPNKVYEWANRTFDLACTVEIIDVEGCRRFPQSFRFAHDPKSGKLPNFFVDEYVKRDFLLTAAEELLPDDTLTMQVDMVVRQYYALQDKVEDVRHQIKSNVFQKVLEEGYKSEKDEEGNKDHSYLILNSTIGRILAEESSYFNRLCATPMSEKNSGYVKIPDANFPLLMKILWYRNVFEITLQYSFKQILDVYALADYYMIESVLDTCRRWLRLVCRTREDASAIANIANKHNDDELLKIAEEAANRIGREIGDGGVYSSEQDEVWTYIVRIWPTDSYQYRLYQTRTVFDFRLRAAYGESWQTGTFFRDGAAELYPDLFKKKPF